MLELARGERLPTEGDLYSSLRMDEVPAVPHLSRELNDIIASMMRVRHTAGRHAHTSLPAPRSHPLIRPALRSHCFSTRVKDAAPGARPRPPSLLPRPAHSLSPTPRAHERQTHTPMAAATPSPRSPPPPPPRSLSRPPLFLARAFVRGACHAPLVQSEASERPSPEHLLQLPYFQRSAEYLLAASRQRCAFYRRKFCTSCSADARAIVDAAA
jgi:hypothetical protein